MHWVDGHLVKQSVLSTPHTVVVLGAAQPHCLALANQARILDMLAALQVSCGPSSSTLQLGSGSPIAKLYADVKISKDTQCIPALQSVPFCADNTWSMWSATLDKTDKHGYFCCLPGQVGLQSGDCVVSGTVVVPSLSAVLVSDYHTEGGLNFSGQSYLLIYCTQDFCRRCCSHGFISGRFSSLIFSEYLCCLIISECSGDHNIHSKCYTANIVFY